jgi:glycosyltransferase involved in cell wall biosynthesis
MIPSEPAVGPDRLRVIQVIPTTKMGGLERVATTLALGLSTQLGRLVVCSSGGPPFEAELRASPHLEFELIPRPRPRPTHLARSAYALARVLRRERPQLVHAHNPAAGSAAALARMLARDRRVAIVTTYHGVVPAKLGRATRALALTSDMVVGVGPTVTRELRAMGLPDDRSATVFNAVDVQPRRSAADVRSEFEAEGSALVVSVGRYRAEKNYALLLEAVSLLAERGRAIRVVLVGGGALEGELRSQAAALALEDVVTLTGERGDAVDIAAAADVFALSSDWEGLPLALVEAMALARAIVATDVRGVTDLVHHEETGLLVPPRDARALADALERLLADENLRERLGRNASALASRLCSEETMLQEYLRIYASVSARRQG